MAGCVTQQQNPYSDEISRDFEIITRDKQRVAVTGDFIVQQGVPVRSRMKVEGAPVRLLVRGGFKEIETLYDKVGTEFVGGFIPKYSGLAPYRIEVAGTGYSKGNLTQFDLPE